MITFSDQKEIDPTLLVRLFDQARWAVGRTEEQACQMLKHTDLVVTAWDGDKLVGFGRVLTDYVFRASIWDVIVDQAYQGKDVGSQLMERILAHPQLSRVELFWLCTRDKQAFYEKLGFSAKEQTGMVWSRSRQATKE